MPIQWRVCGRWALLGAIQKDAHEAFLVLDPLVTHRDAMALLGHLCTTLLQDATLWQHEEAPKSSLFGI